MLLTAPQDLPFLHPWVFVPQTNSFSHYARNPLSPRTDCIRWHHSGVLSAAVGRADKDSDPKFLTPERQIRFQEAVY